MIIMPINSWSSFKTLVAPANKNLSVQYSETSAAYEIFAMEASAFMWTISILKDSGADVTDFEANYKSTANKAIEPRDPDGARILRPKAAKSGWTFSLIPVEITTSTLSTVYSKLVDGSTRSGVTCKIYDSDDAEITTPGIENINLAACVKTVVDFEPTYDYELIGGTIQQNSLPQSNLRVWVIGVPDIPAESGGSKEMVGGVNLMYIDPADKIEADGRVSKYMAYNTTYHTNKLRFILKHNAGLQHNVMIALQLFRA